MTEFEWTIVLMALGGLFGWVGGLGITLLWDMWRHPRSRWAEEARAEIAAARAEAPERGRQS